MRGNWLYRVLLLISGLTIVSGLGQLVRPDLVLRLIGGEVTPTSAQGFGIVGMFMVLFGAMLLHALVTAGDQSVAVLWSGVQKFAAAAAVGLGVGKGIFSALALAVAGFDLLSGILIFAYLRRGRAARVWAPASSPARQPARQEAGGGV